VDVVRGSGNDVKTTSLPFPFGVEGFEKALSMRRRSKKIPPKAFSSTKQMLENVEKSRGDFIYKNNKCAFIL